MSHRRVGRLRGDLRPGNRLRPHRGRPERAGHPREVPPCAGFRRATHPNHRHAEHLRHDPRNRRPWVPLSGRLLRHRLAGHPYREHRNQRAGERRNQRAEDRRTGGLLHQQPVGHRCPGRRNQRREDRRTGRCRPPPGRRHRDRRRRRPAASHAGRSRDRRTRRCDHPGGCRLPGSSHRDRRPHHHGRSRSRRADPGRPDEELYPPRCRLHRRSPAAGSGLRRRGAGRTTRSGGISPRVRAPGAAPARSSVPPDADGKMRCGGRPPECLRARGVPGVVGTGGDRHTSNVRSAATYSPTPSPGQYHRRGRA